jgi:hypothetical protein
MAGRKPLGPALVEHLDGSASAKHRLELILATIAGRMTVVAAADALGISEAMFYKLRSRVLQISLDDLEPKPLGRPSQVQSPEAFERQQLASRVTELERELVTQSVRLELAQTMPQLLRSAEPCAMKKTSRAANRRPKRRRRPR